MRFLEWSGRENSTCCEASRHGKARALSRGMTNTDYLGDMSREALIDVLAAVEACLIAERGVDGDPAPAWMLEEWGKIAAECNRKLAQ